MCAGVGLKCVLAMSHASSW